jgi:hypothetical protein
LSIYLLNSAQRHTVADGTTIESAAKQLSDERLTFLVVRDGQRVLGLVSGCSSAEHSLLACCDWLIADGWWLMMADDGWWLMADGWWLMADGWWLMADGWWLMADGWWLVAGSWWLMADGWWLMMASGWWLMTRLMTDGKRLISPDHLTWCPG